MIFFHAIVLGNLPRKSNSRQWMGKGRLIKSAKALDYVAYAVLQLNHVRSTHERNGIVFPIKYPVVLGMKVWYSNRRSDLSDEIMADILQVKKGAGIISDDNQISRKILDRGVDKKRPRAEIWLAPEENYDEVVNEVFSLDVDA